MIDLYLGNNGAVPLPLTAENAVMLLAAAMALAFDHIPALKARFEQLPAAGKQRTMTELLALLVILAALGGCMGWVNTGFACTQYDLPRLLQVFLAAAASNQAAHLLGKTTAVNG